MALQLRKAERRQAKMRVGVTAPSGGGKTYSALLLARGLASAWDKVALVDTENGSGELYSHLGPYNVITLDAPYTPERYIEAIKACEAGGMEVIILDSASHEWDGPGGCLEIKDKMGGKYQDWAKVTPRHQAFLNAMLFSECHVITTTRRKQDYEMTKDGNGKVTVEKVGLKEVQRDGFEYELTLNFELDIRHNAIASKDRTTLFADKPAFVISEDTGKALKTWCESGAAPIPKADPKAEAKAQTAPAGPRRVVKIDPREWKKSDGSVTPFWTVHFSDGAKGSTFSEDMVSVATRCGNEDTPVDAVIEPGKKPGTFNLTELVPIIPANGDGAAPANDMPF